MTSRRSRQAPAKKSDARPPKAAAEALAVDAQGYVALVAELKQRIADARLRAALSVNRELVLLYRNKMFHLGFEWPNTERDAFERRIVADRWPQDWFSQATSDGKPWVFYLSDTFVQHCLATVDQIFTGLGAFVRRND